MNIQSPTIRDIVSYRTIQTDLDIERIEEVYNSYTVDELCSTPEMKSVAVDNGTVGYYKIYPEGDYDESLVGIRFLEAGNDLAPHQYASALLIAEYFNMKVIVIPHNRYNLDRTEKRAVAGGDLTSVASQLSEALEKLTKSDQVVVTDGASMGAQLAIPSSAQLAKERNVAGVVALENPNSRSDSGLLGTITAFNAAGNDDWEAAERDAAWPALAAIFDDKRYIKQSNIDFIKHFINKDTVMWLGAMSSNSLASDLRTLGNALPTDSPVVVARDAYSAMTPEMGFVEAALKVRTFKPNQLAFLEVRSKLEQRGHAITNNPVARLALMSLVMQRASY